MRRDRRRMRRLAIEGQGLSAIKTARVTDTVYRVLRDGIVNATFAPGSRLNVEEIAQRLHVSRTPIHEALAVLATEGLVDVQPRKGTYVAAFTHQDFVETLAIRRALELLACETACERVDPDEIAELRELMSAMERAVTDTSDTEQAARTHDALNLEFHRRIVALSGNRRLISVYDDLQAHVRIARAHLSATTWRERVPIETQEHGTILAALEARRVDDMRAALDAHIRRSSVALLRDVMTREGEDER